jgi:hypothetical protein
MKAEDIYDKALTEYPIKEKDSVDEFIEKFKQAMEE